MQEQKRKGSRNHLRRNSRENLVSLNGEKSSSGFPSGKGAAEGNVYYLPLRKSASSGKPAVSLIDIAKGKILQTVAAADGELPGNLLIHQDMLISQSATRIGAYSLGLAKK